MFIQLLYPGVCHKRTCHRRETALKLDVPCGRTILACRIWTHCSISRSLARMSPLVSFNFCNIPIYYGTLTSPCNICGCALPVTKTMLKQARKTGTLNLSAKGLSFGELWWDYGWWRAVYQRMSQDILLQYKSSSIKTQFDTIDWFAPLNVTHLHTFDLDLHTFIRIGFIVAHAKSYLSLWLNIHQFGQPIQSQSIKWAVLIPFANIEKFTVNRQVKYSRTSIWTCFSSGESVAIARTWRRREPSRLQYGPEAELGRRILVGSDKPELPGFELKLVDLYKQRFAQLDRFVYVKCETHNPVLVIPNIDCNRMSRLAAR